MSVTEVQGRISEIRSALALLAPRGASAASGSQFAAALALQSAATAKAGSAGAPDAVGGLSVGSGAPLRAGTPYASLFQKAEADYGVSARLLASVAQQESGFDPRAVSSAGARGLMQLMPATAQGLGVRDSFDPAQAVDGAARLLRDLKAEFGRTDLALAAYNAGPGAVHRYGGIPPYPETQNYVRSVLALLEKHGGIA